MSCNAMCTQVIRHKIAEMARQVESTHALLEQVPSPLSAFNSSQLFLFLFLLPRCDRFSLFAFLSAARWPPDRLIARSLPCRWRTR